MQNISLNLQNFRTETIKYLKGMLPDGFENNPDADISIIPNVFNDFYTSVKVEANQTV